jgi:hypothetical protein
LPIAVEAYPRLSERAKNAVLSLIGAIGSREAAEAFVNCIREHGWSDGLAWRFTERYFEARRLAGCWLDLAGYLKSPAIAPLLKNAMKLRDPRLLAYAAAAALRHGLKVPATTIQRRR